MYFIKGVSMLRRIAILISVGLLINVHAEDDKLAKVKNGLDNIMAKAGISFNGEFKSQYFGAKIDGPGVDSSLKQSEANEYTSVDFDIAARPNTALTGRLIFRMHQNWQNFFSDISNPIFSRWISIDGNPKDIFRFNVGDFKQKYSPLTLYTPEIEIMYEPFIFERMRKLAQDEFFLGDNNRVLQGVNLGFDAEIAPIFNEAHIGLIGVRLRSTEVNIENGAKMVESYESDSLMSKYFTGGNVDLTFLKGVSFGGTFLYIFDHAASHVLAISDSTADTLAQKTTVVSLRPGIDIAKTFGMPEALELSLATEFALSKDDSSYYLKGAASEGLQDTAYNGTAINIAAKLGFKAGSAFGAKLQANLISNNKYFRNELAQSPYFIGERIMNIENDFKGIGHYSTFDALYHSVFKFVYKQSVNNFSKAPAMKNSYYNGILSKREMQRLEKSGGLDRSLQLVLPYGMATPNRVGLTSDLCLSILNNGIEIKGLFKSLNEQVAFKDAAGFDITKYGEFGAGVKVEFSNIIKALELPCNVSLSYVNSTALNAGDSSKLDYASTFVNAGVYWKVLKRGAIMFGFQSLNDVETVGDTIAAVKANHVSLGLEWSVSDGASVVGTLGKIIMFNSYGTEIKYEDADWDQNLIDISLRVKF
jgi:hypothetical protein